MHIFDCIERIEKNSQNFLHHSEKQKELYQSCDFDRLISTAEKGLNLISTQHILQRQMLLSLYELYPINNKPLDFYLKRANEIESRALNISLEELEDFDFPVYKLSVPFLLPNKREKKAVLKSAITDAVKTAIDNFYKEKGISPFKHATIIFISLYEGEGLNVDNDNKESSVIINGLIGKMILDDRASACTIIHHSKKIERGAKTEIYIMDNTNDAEVYAAVK